MATTSPASLSGRSVYHNISDNHKRWMVFGIALNHVLVPNILPFVDQEVQREYVNLKTSHNIHTQSSHPRLERWPTFLKYENINCNDTLPKLRGGKCDYSSFDCKVTSHVDFAKLYLENHMAKFNAFDDTCDASAVLTLLGKVPVFSPAVQSATYDVRQARNSWAHCLFSDWDEAYFQKIFSNLKQLVNTVGISNVDLLNNLDDWEKKGIQLCMNATVDPDLVKLVQEHVNLLKKEVNKIAFEREEEEGNRKKIEDALVTRLDELDERVEEIKTQQEILQQRFEEQLSDSCTPEICYEFANCETDIKYLTDRYDPDTRQWLIEDFDQWFRDPGYSRAYVLLGDAAVGKSVMAAVVAQRAKKDGYLAAAYFCRHNDGTRNNPRYLLGTIAHEMCHGNAQYSNLVGGDSGIQIMLANSKASINELFTKLLQEPLGRCDHACKERKLVVIDALDEAEYSSRDDFLDLIMHRFPLLPKWLVFFITSRPEDTVQFRLQTYNPCIRICAGNSETPMFYQQHEQDIQRFLKNKVNISTCPFSLEDITKKCNGMFLYAFYIVEMLKNAGKSARIDQLQDIFPENINEFFRQNFKRIFDKVGTKFYDKLFGCALVAPAPLPISFISFLLKKENSNLDKQEVIDAVSQFVVLRTSDQTINFIHNLIPAWLTDEQKASRRFFVDRNSATQYFRTIVAELLSDCIINEQSKLLPSCSDRDLCNYVLRVGVRFLCGFNDADYLDIVYRCLTSYQFIEKRIKMSKIEIYSFINDTKLFLCNTVLDHAKKEILKELSSVLEGEIHVLSLHPTLLESCLGNASKLVQTSVTKPDRGGAFITLSKWVPLTFCEFRGTDLTYRYFAFSPKKTLLACANRKYIILLEACSFEKVLGPLEVEEHASINHLEFSPDGNFVFFGRLNRWLSVERRCVEEFSQFSGNSRWYEWGSFILDGQYIVAGKNREKHSIFCLITIFETWQKEVDDQSYSKISRILEFLEGLARSYKRLLQCKCDHSVTPAWRHIIDIYADLFTYQIWNMDKGKPALVDLVSKKFEFLHYLYDEFEEKPTYLNRDLLHEYRNRDLLHEYRNPDILHEYRNPDLLHEYRNPDLLHEYRNPDLLHAFLDVAFANTIWRILKETNVKLIEYSPVNRLNSFPFRISHSDPEWSTSSSNGEVKLFKRSKPNKCVYSIKKVEMSAFTSDSSAFFYLLYGKSFCSLSLQTGTKHVSATGLYPLYFPPKGEVGFVFRGDGEENIVLLAKDLPIKFLSSIFSVIPQCPQIKVAFTSDKNIDLVSSRGMITSIKTEAADECLEFDTESGFFNVSRHLKNCKHIEECTFSEDGKLFAAQQGSEILLFKNGRFLKSILKCKNVSFLMFSPDGSFFLCCVQASNDTQDFYLCDVDKEIISALESLTTGMTTVECCCFSPDNTKLILCGDSFFQVWQYPVCTNMPMQTVQTFSQHNRSNTFSCCSVSSNNEWLACCITNRILMYRLDTLSEQQVPHGHSGRVEFCRFLKGDSYLISYGVDNIVFLFDLSEWKTISYVRISYGNEYIVSMAVSPNEDKAVCLTSPGRLNLIKLCGLQENKALKFPLTTRSQNHGQLTEQYSPKLEVISEISMMQEMNEMLPSDTDSNGDDDGSVEDMEVE